MTDMDVWFITGAGRGMGVDIAKAAAAAGSAVVATGRNTDTVRAALGQDDHILAAKLAGSRPLTRRTRRQADAILTGYEEGGMRPTRMGFGARS